MRASKLSSICMLVAAVACAAADIQWTHLSSTRNEVPDPGGSKLQTGALVTKLDRQKGDGLFISYRVHGPALVWIRPAASG